jgi:hypothetical protein
MGVKAIPKLKQRGTAFLELESGTGNSREKAAG